MLESHAPTPPSSLPAIDSTSADELEERLGLYRVFLRLYEQHRNLLDEILDLEDGNNHYRRQETSQYVQAVVQGEGAYLITNLPKGKTQAVYTPRMLWVIGRDRRLTLKVSDKRMSRLHAAIQYKPGKGFYLIDLNSTNGSYINSEPIRHAMPLKDGDRIRLGSLAFNFFICHGTQVIEDAPAEVLAQLNSLGAFDALEDGLDEDELEPEEISVDWDSRLSGDKDTLLFRRPRTAYQEESLTSLQVLSDDQQAEILDRFLHR
ncbi:MAG: FHA domain-containing protein [Scytolyngbya sp. HA4215-MV1]|jgi:pSer/pThr/pTyr-binding forkhead associated (FHA) protein|nr:FHA domain-containing protein [Scytolyngbya sp. HA4215-MV1]